MILSTHLFCLLNLSTTPQLFPAFAFSLHISCIRPYTSVQPTKYYSLFTMRDLLCVIYYARFTMHDLLCTMHYALYTVYYALCIMHYYVLCTMHYALCTMHYLLLCTMHYYALCITMHYALFTMHLYVFIRLLFYTYSYVFTISHGNPAKSRDFGTHA